MLNLYVCLRAGEVEGRSEGGIAQVSWCS
eukprot:COSAG04_NODE_28260_length_277_cov_0.337079_1_plen_28_part_10